MNRPYNGTNSSSGAYRRVRRLTAAVGVVVMVMLVVGACFAPITAAQDDGDNSSANEKFAIKQGDTCNTVSPLGDGSDNVASFYDYRTHGHGYSSRGTTDLQVKDTSQLFFYKGNGGLSLVFLHGKFTGSRDDGGGAVTLVMKGLPVTGGWTVKDDGYSGANDSFTFNKSMATASWGWDGGRADGGVYRADPSEWDSEVTIEPHFNKEADSYPYPAWDGEGTMHQIQRWIVRSGDGKEHALNLYQDVKIKPGTCESLKKSENGSSESSTNKGADDESESGLKTIATGPGFGVLLTMLALVVALVAIAARNRR